MRLQKEYSLADYPSYIEYISVIITFSSSSNLDKLDILFITSLII